MGQYLAHVQKVFTLIRIHKKDLEAAVRTKSQITIKSHPKAKKA